MEPDWTMLASWTKFCQEWVILQQSNIKRTCLYIDLLPTDDYVVEFIGNTKVDRMDEYPNS